MAERPSDRWRSGVAQEAADWAAGTPDCDEPYLADLFPESLLTATDEALARFEAQLRWPTPPTDDKVFAVVERVVLDLNRINKDHDNAGYETSERDELCEYINACLAEAGVDVDALAARRGISRWDITDRWRRW